MMSNFFFLLLFVIMSHIDCLYYLVLDYCDFETLWNHREFFGDSYIEKRASTTPFSIVAFCNYIRGPFDYPDMDCHIVIGQNKPRETHPDDIYDIRTIDPLYDIPSFQKRYVWGSMGSGSTGSPHLWNILRIQPRYLWVEYEYTDIALMHRLYRSDPTIEIPEHMYIPILLGIGGEDTSPWFEVGDGRKDGWLATIKWGGCSDDVDYLEVPPLPENFRVVT